MHAELLTYQTERICLVDSEQRDHVRREPGDELFQRKQRRGSMDGIAHTYGQYRRFIYQRRRRLLSGTEWSVVLGTGIRVLIATWQKDEKTSQALDGLACFFTSQGILKSSQLFSGISGQVSRHLDADHGIRIAVHVLVFHGDDAFASQPDPAP